MKNSLFVMALLCGLLCCSCAHIRGAGDGVTSRPAKDICLSRTQYLLIKKMQIRCIHDRESAAADCEEKRRLDAIGHRTALRLRDNSLRLCRDERDSLAGRRCPACRCPPSWPYVVLIGVLGVGVVVLGGALVWVGAGGG